MNNFFLIVENFWGTISRWCFLINLQYFTLFNDYFVNLTNLLIFSTYMSLTGPLPKLPGHSVIKDNLLAY